MKYYILVKATGDNRDLYKFYKENGEVYEVDNIEALTKMYNKIIETTPTSLVKPIHLLDVELNTEITGCGNAASDPDPINP